MKIFAIFLKKRSKRTAVLQKFIILGLLLCTASVLFYVLQDRNNYVSHAPVHTFEINWKRYTSDEIDFNHPDDWIIEEPSKTNETGFYLVDYSSHNQKVWTLSRDGIGGSTTASIRIIKNYSPDPIILEADTEYHKFLLLPNNSGYADISFSSGEYYQEISQEDFPTKIIEPFMDSIVLREIDWIETEPTLQTQSRFTTANWKTYTNDRFSIQYPPGWYIDENWRNDSDHANDVVIRKTTTSSYFDFPSPAIIIGSGAVFSTSGALCGNGTCGPDVGVAEVRINGNTYFARIIDKNGRTVSKSNNQNEFLYVFRIVPDNDDADMYITTTFANFNQGQQIVNMLSTLRNTESY